MTLGERCDEIVRLIDETLGHQDSSPNGRHPEDGAATDPGRTSAEDHPLVRAQSLQVAQEP